MTFFRLTGWFKLLDKKEGSRGNIIVDDHQHSLENSDSAMESCDATRKRIPSLAFHLDKLNEDDALLASFDQAGKQPFTAEDFNFLKVLGQGGFGKV